MTPVLILHGALGDAVQLMPVRKLFEGEGYPVHTLNFSGHGGSSFQRSFGIDQFAQDVLDYLNTQHLEKVNIFGYSMGGYVALWLAHLHPERIDKIITLGTKFDWDEASAAKEVKKLNAEKILEKIPAFARILEHRHAPNDWKELLSKTGDMMIGLGKNPVLTKDILQTIQHAVLVCLGDQDDMADRTYSEEVAECLPNGAFRLLTKTPHPIEKVDKTHLAQLVKSFL
jgi:pimeloyl-ACP methyl ester carboxylesterase